MNASLVKLFVYIAAISLVFFLSAGKPAFSQGQDASQFDLSTDDGVNAAREALLGRKLNQRSARCILRGKTLPLIAVGAFAFDWGCRFEGVFVKSKYFKPGQAETWKEALDLLGWQTAARANRERLAAAWVRESWLAFLTVLTERNADFQKRAFQPPALVSNDQGEIVVTIWIAQPKGRTRGRSYELREFKFSKDGAFIRATTRENFTAGPDQ